MNISKPELHRVLDIMECILNNGPMRITPADISLLDKCNNWLDVIYWPDAPIPAAIMVTHEGFELLCQHKPTYQNLNYNPDPYMEEFDRIRDYISELNPEDVKNLMAGKPITPPKESWQMETTEDPIEETVRPLTYKQKVDILLDDLNIATKSNDTQKINVIKTELSTLAKRYFPTR